MPIEPTLRPAGVRLPQTPAGTLMGLPVAVALPGVSISDLFSPWTISTGALSPFLIGTSIHFQGLVTGDGSPHGAFTNVMSFVIQ